MDVPVPPKLRPRRAVQPPSCSRTLHQPSLLPLYVAAGLGTSQNRDSQPGFQTSDCDSPEAFSTHSTPWGKMIPSTVNQVGPASRHFRLNARPPLMCTSPAAPSRADPFRNGPHALRNLGGPTLRAPSDVHPGRMVLQLSPEEDQAITCLLKLRYQGAADTQVGRGDFGPADEGLPGGTVAGWVEFRQMDTVEHYEEYMLPIPSNVPDAELTSTSSCLLGN